MSIARLCIPFLAGEREALVIRCQCSLFDDYNRLSIFDYNPHYSWDELCI